MARELYFYHNKQRYECGTVVVLYDDYFKDTYERVFLYYLPDSDMFTLQRKEGGAWLGMSGREFRNNIIEVKNEICETMRNGFISKTGSYNRKPTFKEELMDDNLLIAWIWYVFIMGISIILNDCIAIWIFASFVFFKYRHKKLRERGFKL